MVKKKVKLNNFIYQKDIKLKILYAVVILIVSFIIGKSFGIILRKMQENRLDTNINNKLLIDFISKVSYVLIMLTGSFFALKIIGFDLSTILVVLGSVGIGIALALKDFLAGCVNGIVIVYMNYFKMGDLLQVDDLMGNVVDFNLLNTTLEDIEGIRHIVPNTKLVDDKFANLSKMEYAWTGAEACISNSAIDLDVKSLLEKFNKELVEMEENDKKEAYTYVEEMNKYGTVIGGGIDVKAENFYSVRKLIRLKLRDFLRRNKVLLCGPLKREPYTSSSSKPKES